MNNLSPLEWYTRCAFEHDGACDNVQFLQTWFIDSMVNRFNISSTRLIPADPSTDLRSRTQGEGQSDPIYYQAVGCVIWVANITTPENASAVREVARHNHDASAIHWRAVMNIMRYLRETRESGLVFRKDKGLYMYAHADSDFAGSLDHRRSITPSAT